MGSEDDRLLETVKSIYAEEGYTGAINFLYRRGYTREDAQAYLKKNFAMPAGDNFEVKNAGDRIMNQIQDNKVMASHPMMGDSNSTATFTARTFPSPKPLLKKSNFISRFFSSFGKG